MNEKAFSFLLVPRIHPRVCILLAFMSNVPPYVVNIWLACTNIFFIFPILRSYLSGDMTTFYMLVNVTLASIISHLFECHQWNMPGFECVGAPLSYLLNRWDVVSCILLAGRITGLVFVHYKGLSWRLIGVIISIACECLVPVLLNLLPKMKEFQPITEDTSINMFYVISHTLWHLSIPFVILHILHVHVYSFWN